VNPGRSASRLPWLLVCLTATALVGWAVSRVADRERVGDAAPAARGIMVVEGRSVESRVPIIAPEARPTGVPESAAPPVREAIAHVARVYPLLRDVAIVCDADRCTLTGLILPPTGKAYLAQRQEMLVGGLAALLSEEGYAMAGPPQLDEIDDNTFRLHASLTMKRNG